MEGTPQVHYDIIMAKFLTSKYMPCKSRNTFIDTLMDKNYSKNIITSHEVHYVNLKLMAPCRIAWVIIGHCFAKVRFVKSYFPDS